MPLVWPDPQPDSTKANTKEADTRNVLLQVYSDHGQWARHYSTVRMTLGTFFITASIGLITFRWDAPELPIAIIAGTVFCFGVVLFLYFSSLTFHEMNAQFDVADSYRQKLEPAPVTPIKRLKLFNATAVPLVILFVVAFFSFDLWWLWGSKPASKTSQITVPMKVKVGQQPEVTVDVPIKIVLP